MGEVVPFAATVFREGHDLIGATLTLTAPDGSTTTHAMGMRAVGTDRWHADVQVEQPGEWQWCVEAYSDDWATWLHAATVKIAADVDVELMLVTGAELLERASVHATEADDAAAAAVLTAARTAMSTTSLTPSARLAVATDARLRRALEPVTRGAGVLVVAQRVATIVGADRIVLLEDGRMAGSGSHEELLRTSATYREIVASQHRVAA